MNILIQICGLAIMLWLLCFYISQKRVGLYTEKIFTIVFATTTISGVLNIAAILAKQNMDKIPEVWLDVICKSHVASMVCVTFLGMIYSLTEMYSEKEFWDRVKKFSSVLVIAVVMVYWFPLDYSSGRDYATGFSVTISYIFSIAFVTGSIYTILRYGKRVSKKRRRAVLIWMILWILSFVAQIFYPDIMLMGFACALGMMSLFFALENPQSNMDRQFGCFHSHAMMGYLNQCFERRVGRSVLLISMSGYQVEGMENETIDNSIRILVQYLEKQKKIKEMKIFKSVEQELIVTFADMSEMTKVFQKIQDTYYEDQFYEHVGVHDMASFPRTLFVLLPDTAIMRNPKEILRLFQHVKMENRDNNNSQVCYVDRPILTHLREREEIRYKIIQALKDDRVEVFFQPIYSNREKKFVSAEALVRIRYRDGKLLSPGRFISVAEDSGLILQLGERVFEKTCQFLSEHDISKYGLRYVEVNLSIVQCERRDLADRFIRIMKKYHVQPYLINLEITETGSTQSKMYLMKNMKKLIDYGVSFSLDDFGNGQSNLDYMIDMPISIVKLDMNMTAVYFKDLKARFVVLATIRMAHEMDLMIVAEGIETKEQLDEMQKQGIDFIQGYYFSRPLPTDEFIAFLDTNQK